MPRRQSGGCGQDSQQPQVNYYRCLEQSRSVESLSIPDDIVPSNVSSASGLTLAETVDSLSEISESVTTTQENNVDCQSLERYLAQCPITYELATEALPSYQELGASPPPYNALALDQRFLDSEPYGWYLLRSRYRENATELEFTLPILMDGRSLVDIGQIRREMRPYIGPAADGIQLLEEWLEEVEEGSEGAIRMC